MLLSVRQGHHATGTQEHGIVNPQKTSQTLATMYVRHRAGI